MMMDGRADERTSDRSNDEVKVTDAKTMMRYDVNDPSLEFSNIRSIDDSFISHIHHARRHEHIIRSTFRRSLIIINIDEPLYSVASSSNCRR